MHKKKGSQIIFAILLVPRTGLEPAHLAELPPEDSVSTNFTTWALMAQNYTCFFIGKPRWLIKLRNSRFSAPVELVALCDFDFAIKR
jgi:hypothetical protein